MNPRAIIPSLSAEEEFILCCGRAVMEPEHRARLAELSRQSLDWKRIDEIARLHRLRPLLFKHLKADNDSNSIPQEIRAKIQKHAGATVIRNLSLTNELAKILKRFREHQIEAIPFKGPVLALKNYGNLGLREFFDMDLLLRREDLLPAKKLLLDLGFTSPEKQNEQWEAQHIDAQLGCDFLSADGKVRLELHWSFIQKWLSYEVDLESIWSRAQSWELAGLPIRVIAPDDLLIYLCAHGAKHHWERLFWIIDIAEIVRTEKALDWPNLITQARRRGNYRVLALGLRLANALLGAPLPREIQIDHATQHLAEMIGGWLFNEANRPASGSRAETKFYLGVKERFTDQVAYSAHLLKLMLAPSDNDRAFVRLPKPLAFLYPAVRPIRWLVQRR